MPGLKILMLCSIHESPGGRPGYRGLDVQAGCCDVAVQTAAGLHHRPASLAEELKDLGYDVRILVANGLRTTAPEEKADAVMGMIAASIRHHAPDVLLVWDPRRFDGSMLRTLSPRPALVIAAGDAESVRQPGCDAFDDCIDMAPLSSPHGGIDVSFFSDLDQQNPLLQGTCLELSRAAMGFSGELNVAFHFAAGHPEKLPCGIAMFHRGPWSLSTIEELLRGSRHAVYLTGRNGKDGKLAAVVNAAEKSGVPLLIDAPISYGERANVDYFTSPKELAEKIRTSLDKPSVQEIDRMIRRRVTAPEAT
jgi:hypothetical protein